jgi:hypothetical protein
MDGGDTRIANAESIEQAVVVQRMAARYAQEQGGFIDNEQVGVAKQQSDRLLRVRDLIGRCVVSG